MKGRSRAAEREHRERAWLAWHIAALPRMKRFPTFDKFAGKPKSRQKVTGPQRWEVLLARARLWSAAAGPKGKA